MIVSSTLAGSKDTLTIKGLFYYDLQPVSVRVADGKIVALGNESAVPVIQWDIFPILCDLFGLPVPENIDGESLLPLLQGKSIELKRKSLYWHFPYYHPPKSYEGTKPCSAIREGNYKLIYFYEDERTELYDLENDWEETNDLSSKLPEQASKLKALLLHRLKRADARFPAVNPDYKSENN